MGWSNAFLTEINSPTRSPVWALETIRLLSGGVGGSRDYASHTVVGSGYSARLKIGSVRTGGARLNPLSWTSTQGAFTVELFGDISDILFYLTKGSAVRLMLGFEGWDPSQFQPVGLGVVKNVRGKAPKWTLECWDLIQAMQTRLASDPDKLELFYGLGTTTTITNPYTTAHTELLVVATADFGIEEPAVGNAYGAIFVDPVSLGADPFYLEYDSTTSTKFDELTSRDILGTSPVGFAAATLEDLVYEIAYIKGHPIDSIAKILTSTGVTGFNGDFDSLPVSWGYGLPDYLVDFDDMERAKSGILVAGAVDYEFTMVSHEPQSNGLQWIQSQLAGAGIFLTQRQGHLTARVVQDPNGFETEPVVSGIEIGDSDIMDVVYEAWDSQQAAEYETWSLGIHGTPSVGTYSESDYTGEDGIGTLPVGALYESFAAIDTDHDNALDMILEISKRIKWWYWRIAERLTLTCAGLRLAQLCPGDIVTITSDVLYGRSEAKRAELGFNGRRAMVYGVDPDWIGGTVTVILAILPDYGD